MGTGTPCPMPPENRLAIHERLLALRASGERDLYKIAEAMQDLWPGCERNHVRGAIAGLRSREVGGPGAYIGERHRHIKKPWKPGEPKPQVRS